MAEERVLTLEERVLTLIEKYVKARDDIDELTTEVSQLKAEKSTISSASETAHKQLEEMRNSRDDMGEELVTVKRDMRRMIVHLEIVLALPTPVEDEARDSAAKYSAEGALNSMQEKYPKE